MRVVVTGGAGYIGSHTSNLLIEQGYDVTVIDDLSTGFQDSLSDKVEFIKGNILEPSFVDSVFSKSKFDAVIHFAAKLIVSESCEKPAEYYLNNVVGSMNVFSQCIRHNIKNIVFSSTAAVYGNSDKKILSESDPLEPINPYGQTKSIVEKMLQDYSAAHGFNYVALRYFNVAGAHIELTNGQKMKNATHLIKLAAEAALGRRKRVDVFGTNYETPDGTCIRDYIHILDLAEAHVRALEYLVNEGRSDIFNCGYGSGSSVYEVLRAMQKVSKKDFEILVCERRPGDPACVIADNTKIKSKLKWIPKFNDLELICKTAFDWEAKNV